MTGFSEDVHSLDFDQVARSLPDRSLPKNLSDYSLTPITTNRFLDLGGSSMPTADSIKEDDIRFDGLIPWLDASLAVGLVYKGELQALSAAGITENGRLRVAQIQGLKRKAGNGRSDYKDNGLNGGISWRQTLVNAWVEIAKMHGIKQIEIQRASQSSWYHLDENLGHEKAEAIRQNLIRGYDQLAKNIGFVLDSNGNWVKEI